jgi:hypothetical protein
MRKIHLQMDGNQIVATWDDFDCLAVSPAGFGDNIGEAVSALINETASYALNGIVSSIENAAHLTNSSRITEARGEDRASKSEESPGTVPGVPAANTASPQLLALVALMKVSATVSTTAVLKVIYDEFPQLRA